MPSIREKYFSILKEESKYINKDVLDIVFSFTQGLDKTELYLNFDSEIKDEKRVDEIIIKIKQGYPIQYIFNTAYFLGEELYVDDNVLIPRQETEQLVLDSISLIKNIFKDQKVNILDVGTGSGNIAILLSKRVQNAIIHGIDKSLNAVNVANKNKDKLSSNATFSCQDIFDDIENNYDVIISNPPYIKDSSTVEFSTLKYEPNSALFATPQYIFYERIIDLAVTSDKTKLMCFEIEENMRNTLREIVHNKMPSATFFFSKDLYNKDRFLYIIKGMDKDIINKAKDILNNHGVIAFPTDTVMGLAVKYDDILAFDKLNKIKRRPASKPYTLMVSSPNDISKYAFLSDRDKKIIDTFLPGPLTVLLNAHKDLPYQVDYSSGIIGIRVAPNEVIKNIIDAVGPLLVPSANRSGEPTINNSLELRIKIPEIDYVIDGEAKSGISTTIVDLTKSNIKIIREGDIKLEDIMSVL